MQSSKASQRLFLTAAIASVLLLLTLHSSAQTDLTGFWVFRVPTGDGNFRESFFDLKQDGAKISGKSIQGTRETPFTDGTFADGKLHFVLSFNFGNPPQTRTVTYHGVLD